jgi:phosphinothricin acetyltransferase
MAGYAYAGRHSARAAYQWSVDTSVYIHADFRRCGVGRGLYKSLFEILIAQGYCNAYAGITLPNAGSVGLHESVGFQPVGVYRSVGFKMGAWHDVGWWQLELQPRMPQPREPVSIGQVQSDATRWQHMLAAGLACIRPAIREVSDRPISW